jgi:hypothetical protein
VAFLTLTVLRTDYFNLELGLASDADNSFGTTAARDFYLQNAIRKLWPDVAKLTSETVTPNDDDQTYVLTTVEDVERLEVLDSGNNQVLSSTIRSWQIVRDESTDPPTLRLLIPQVTAGYSIRVIGYTPYVAPASGGSVDFPTRMAHVVVAGARVEAYRAKLNQFANFEQFANENRSNVLTPPEILELLRQAEREWERGKRSVARDFSAPKRARTQLSR